MTSKEYSTVYDQFAGWSDRASSLMLTRWESPDLRNVEWVEEHAQRRAGFRRVHTNRLRDCSIRFDGMDDYLRIRHITAYNPGANALSVNFDVALRAFPTAETVLLSKGTGTGASRFFRLSYDPTLNGNNGGWKIIAYDSVGAALRTFTVNDGAGASTAAPVHFYRHISLTCTTFGSRTYTMTVTDSAGSLVGASGTAVVNWISSTDDWIVGSDTPSTLFTQFSGAELRFRVHDASFDPVPWALLVDRELTDAEAALMTGYWKMNDGQGSVIADSSPNGNDAVAEVEGPAWLGEWNGNGSLVLGRSGLAFWGGAGHVHIKPGAGVPALIFNNSATATRNWTIGMLWVPLIAQSETTVRSQTLFWTGTNTTVPGPVGLVVTSSGGSQRLQVQYRDGTNVKTATLTTLSLNAGGPAIGVPVRIEIALGPAFGGEYIRLSAIHGATPYVAQTATDNADPGLVGNDWSLGRQVTSYTYPQTFNGTAAFAVLDDFAVFKSFSTTPVQGVFSYQNVFVEWSFLSTFQLSNVQRLFGLPLNEGYGNVLEVNGSYAFAADLYPEEEQGLIWDEGLVDPYRPVEARLLCDFNRIDAGGAVIRRHLVVSGTTLYEVDEVAGIARAVRGNIHKGGKVSYANWRGQIIFAAPNGKRPRIYNGANLDWLGIRAPFQTPVAVAGGGGSGSLAAGTYHIYVTYRNASNGSESNPSPFTTITAAANDKVDSIQLPVSSDPQVTQRRVWMTVANGGAGSTAYLVAQIDDNVTVNYTTDITAINLGAATLIYTDNQEAPLGSIVASHKDRVFVAGHPSTPNYIFYSQPGIPSAFNHAVNFEDADLDTGDVVTLMRSLRDYIVIHFADGRVSMTPTGSTSQPFYTNTLSRDQGAVGPYAALEFESTHVYASERDFWIWDGSQALNITSPADPSRPSIQTFVRQQMEPTRRRDISVALHKAKNQFIFCLASVGKTYNDTLVVYNWDQGKFSRYDIDVDIVATLEDQNDDPWLFGVHQGFLVRMDTGVFDGTARTIADLAQGVASGTTTTVNVIGPAWTSNEFKGLWCMYYHAEQNVITKRRIASNGAASLTFYDALPFAPADGDGLNIAGLDYYLDFVPKMGNPYEMKKLKYLVMRLSCDNVNTVRLVTQNDNLGRMFDPTQGASYVRNVGTGTHTLRINLGTTGGHFRFRIGDTTIEEQAPWNPGLQGNLQIHGMELISEKVGARLS